MISESTYDHYFENLIKGNRQICSDMVDGIMDSGESIRNVYDQLFRRSLYQVGELWERNLLSVATEHMATAITENLMIKMQPQLFSIGRTGKKAVIACLAKEHHQVGAKMIADIFEMHGWDGYFVGANKPAGELIKIIEKIQPDLIGLSLSVYFNIGELRKTLKEIREHFPGITVIIGGQAFRWGGATIANEFTDVHYIDSIYTLESMLDKADTGDLHFKKS